MAGAKDAMRAVSAALFGGTAVLTAVAVGGVAVTTPGSVASTPVQLSALVVAGSSTNPTGAGVDAFFQGRFNPPGTQIEWVDFFAGPQGIHSAVTRTPETDVVLSSGWGAANASAILSWYALTDPDNPVVTDNLWVLDNNVARPNGGWGTRYPVFALIGVNPVPTPEIEGVRVIDTAYQYDANSNAPAYFLNPVATLNSLVAYAQVRLNQDQLYLPVQDDGSIVDSTGAPVACAVTCRVLAGTHPDGAPRYAQVKIVGHTTYVTYEANGLPLVQPLKLLGPGGVALAAALEPALTVLVKAGYPDNDPMANPDRYVPGAILPPPRVVATAARQLPAAVREGVETLRRDDERPAVAGLEASASERETAPKRRSSPNFSTRVSAPDTVDNGDATPRRFRGPTTPTAVDASETISTREQRDRADTVDETKAQVSDAVANTPRASDDRVSPGPRRATG